MRNVVVARSITTAVAAATVPDCAGEIPPPIGRLMAGPGRFRAISCGAAAPGTFDDQT